MAHTRRTERTMQRAFLTLFLLSVSCVSATPEYFTSVANQVLRLQGGAEIGGDTHVHAVAELEQHVKRVMGADPALDLNVSSLRDRPEPELLRILFLAVLGNFTSPAAPEWNQPCRLVVDPQSGHIALQDTPPAASESLKVVVILLVAVQLYRKLQEQRESPPAMPEAHAKQHAR